MESLTNPRPGDDPNARPLTPDDLARFRAELVNDLASAVGGVRFAPVPFGRFAAEYLASYEPPMRSKHTHSRVRYVLNLVSGLLPPDATTEALTTDLVVRFIQSRPPGESPATTRGTLAYLKTMLTTAAAEGRVRYNPFALRKRWVRGPRRVAEKKHHPLEAIRRVLELARRDVDRKAPGSPSQWRARRLQALAALAAYTGARRNELLYLRVEDVDIPNRVIHIRPRLNNELKTDAAAAPIPMVDPLAAVLADWLPHLSLEGWESRGPEWGPATNPRNERDPGWVIPNAYRTGPWTGGPRGKRPIDRLKRLGERVGTEGLTFQSLRHSWASHAESAWGLTDLQIQRVLRHTTTKTQEHYRHADLANLKAAVAGVTFGGPDDAPVAVAPAEATTAPAPPARCRDPKNPSKPGVYHRPVLSKADVAEMRELRARGWTYTALLVRYGCSKSTLHSALHGLTHRDVPMPPGSGREG